MHVGLFFGSFNPIHIGHTALANYMLSFTNMEEVWLVVSPQNPLKIKKQLLNQNDRLLMVNLALDDSNKIKSCNIEFKLPIPSYTINTLTHLKTKYPKYQFSLIMGHDNLKTFNKWKNYQLILKEFKIFVYPRQNSIPTEFDSHPNINITNAPLMDISSTFIRNALQNKKDIRFFLTQKVWEEIDSRNLYRK